MRPVILVVAALAACSYDPPAIAPSPDAAPRPIGMIDGACEGEPGRPRVLVYTYENLWRHASNYSARGALLDMCASRGFHVTTTNDPRAINATRLAAHDVIVLAVTSGNGLDAAGKADLEAWIRAGGGYVGLEAAAATEVDWPFHVDVLGAAFLRHPPGLQLGTVRVEPTGHPITDGLPASFALVEQWYSFDRRPEDVPGLEVLLALDEDSLPPEYPEDYKVGYHAIGWAHARVGGRVFYTGLGDNPATFADPVVLDLLGQAIEWTARDR